MSGVEGAGIGRGAASQRAGHAPCSDCPPHAAHAACLPPQRRRGGGDDTASAPASPPMAAPNKKQQQHVAAAAAAAALTCSTSALTEEPSAAMAWLSVRACPCIPSCCCSRAPPAEARRGSASSWRHSSRHCTTTFLLGWVEGHVQARPAGREGEAKEQTPAGSKAWMRQVARPLAAPSLLCTPQLRPRRTHSSSERYCCVWGLRSSHLEVWVMGRPSLVASAVTAWPAAGCAPPNKLGAAPV